MFRLISCNVPLKLVLKSTLKNLLFVSTSTHPKPPLIYFLFLKHTEPDMGSSIAFLRWLHNLNTLQKTSHCNCFYLKGIPFSHKYFFGSRAFISAHINNSNSFLFHWFIFLFLHEHDSKIVSFIKAVCSKPTRRICGMNLIVSHTVDYRDGHRVPVQQQQIINTNVCLCLHPLFCVLMDHYDVTWRCPTHLLVKQSIC